MKIDWTKHLLNISEAKDAATIATRIVLMGLAILAFKKLEKGIDAIEKVEPLVKDVSEMSGTMKDINISINSLNNKVAVVISTQKSLQNITEDHEKRIRKVETKQD